MSVVLDIRRLSISYDANRRIGRRSLALRDLNCLLHSGEMLCVLGPSGAGKTTLIRTILGDIPVTEGSLQRFGETTPPDFHRGLVGTVPEVFSFPNLTSGLSILLVEGKRLGLHGKTLERRLVAVAESLGLSETLCEYTATYPLGTRVMLALARALLPSPRLLLLDDTAEHLDAAGQRRLLGILNSIRHNGAAVVLTSHSFAETEATADRLLLLHRGIPLATGLPSDLFPSESSFLVEVAQDPQLSPGWTFFRHGDRWCSAVNGKLQLDQLLRALTVRGIAPRTILPSHQGVESMFAAFRVPRFPQPLS